MHPDAKGSGLRSGLGAERPNLLYIHSDQHSARVMGCGGDSLVLTPNLDGLARRGMLFTNVYCPSPLCGPSRMAMLTGRYPHETGVWTNEHFLNSGIPTLAHAMGAAGYRPILIGRMHAVGPDQLHGYVERHVGDHRPNFPGGKPVDHGMLEGTQDPGRISLEKSGIGRNAYQLHDQDVTDAVVKYLDALGERKRRGKVMEPFNLSVGFMLPHQPYVALREDFELYAGRMTMPDPYEPRADRQHPVIRRWRERQGILDVPVEDVLRARTAYWALVTRLDAMIGGILHALRENGLDENTIILYSSDHGEQAGDHGLWWKHTFYESSVKVPAILSWPGIVPTGRCDRVISSLDLNATMLALLGAPPLPNSHGRNVVPMLRSAKGEWTDIAWSEYCTEEYCGRMVRSGDWKLNYHHGGPVELYNLREDPKELDDLASSARCVGLRERLTDLALEDWTPERISRQMSAQKRDTEIIHRWAESTAPADLYRWDLRPDMDSLENSR